MARFGYIHLTAGYLMKIYTRTGDKGDTALFGGQRVPKDALRVEAYGTIDELNSVLGIALADTNDPELELVLKPIQSLLFDLGADLATPLSADTAPLRRIGAREASGLESVIDRLSEHLDPLKSFILPGGSPLAARLHFARTVCRRAERVCVRLSRNEDIGDAVIVFLNRLSDLLFVLARYANVRAHLPEIQWKSTAGGAHE
jgi:cob(I)alamin adenosyltransferase